MAQYKRTSLNFVQGKKSHSDADLFLSLLGKLKTEVIVKLVINYLQSCNIDDVTTLDKKTAKRMAEYLLTPNESTIMSRIYQTFYRNGLVSNISPSPDIKSVTERDTKNKTISPSTSIEEFTIDETMNDNSINDKLSDNIMKSIDSFSL